MNVFEEEYSDGDGPTDDHSSQSLQVGPYGVAGMGRGGKSLAFARSNYYDHYAEGHFLFQDMFFQSLRGIDNSNRHVVSRSTMLLVFENPAPIALNFDGCPYLAIHRGDHVLPMVSFDATGHVPPLWPSWITTTPDCLSHKAVLEKLNSLDVLEVSKHCHVTRIPPCFFVDLEMVAFIAHFSTRVG